MGNVRESGVLGGFYGGNTSQTFKSNYGDWSRRYSAYDAQGMQELKSHYDSIIAIMQSANDDIDSSGIDFAGLKKIDLAYTYYDVQVMENMRKNLADFSGMVYDDSNNLIDQVLNTALSNLEMQITEHEELAISYLGTPFDLEYNIKDPRHLSDWLYKSVDGNVDDFLYTGDPQKDKIIEKYMEKDEESGRYGFEDAMDEWDKLSNEDRELVRHILSHYAGQYDVYFDDSNKYARMYQEILSRMLTRCTTVESFAADASNPDTYDPEDPGRRILTYSSAGKDLMGMVQKGSYEGQLLSGLSQMDCELYSLIKDSKIKGITDFQYIYGDLNSGVTFKVKVSHDRAATAMSLGLSCDNGKDAKGTEANREYYETYKDSFDGINNYLSQKEPFAYFTDYRRSLGYVNKNNEIDPTRYEHLKNMGMNDARIALILSKSKNRYDMECLDELTKTRGSYNEAFSVDANKLSGSAKDQIKSYVGAVKDKAYSEANPYSDACWEDLVRLCVFFDEAESKELAGYWPICEEELAKTRTDLKYMAYRQSEYYDPEFESKMRMAEQMASGAPYSQQARDAWFKDSQNQQAYYLIMQAKHPDLVGAGWEDMSKEQKERFGDISKVFDEEHRMIMLKNIEDIHKAEALYMIDEKNGLNAEVYAIYDKIKDKKKVNLLVEVADPYTLLTEEEQKKIETYVLRNSVNPSMTQQGYEALGELSKVVTNHIEKDPYYREAAAKGIDKPLGRRIIDVAKWGLTGSKLLEDLDTGSKYDYYALKRGSEQDILYLAAKEAHNTAYVQDESWQGYLIHGGDAFAHGVGSIVKPFVNLDHYMEKKIGWGDDTYQKYIDYENQVFNRNFDQAQEFSPFLYGAGEITRDMVLMYVGGLAFEATGVTEAVTLKATEGMTSALGKKVVTGGIEVMAEQVVPTVVCVIPHAVEGVAEGKSAKEIAWYVFKEEGANVILSGGIRIGKTVFTAEGRNEVVKLYNIDKEARVARKADNLAMAYREAGNSQAFLGELDDKKLKLLIKGLEPDEAAKVMAQYDYKVVEGAYNALTQAEKEEVAKLWYEETFKQNVKLKNNNWAAPRTKEFLETSELYAQQAVKSGAVPSTQKYYEMYISRDYKYSEKFIADLKQEYLDNGASSIVGEGTINFAFDGKIDEVRVASIGRKPVGGRADGCFVTTTTEDAALLYDASGNIRNYQDIAQMKGIAKENLKDGIYQYYYDPEFIQNCEKAGIFEQVQGTNSGANILNIPGGKTWAGKNMAWSETELICPTIDVSQYSAKDVFKAINSKKGCFEITNPSVYLSDGSTTVIEGKFTIRKLN